MKFIAVLTMASLFILGGCSSSKHKEKLEVQDNTETIKKDYEVRDASHTMRPAWVQNAILWADEVGKDGAKFRYHSYQTGVKVDRETACSLAKTYARADIASEISSFIQKTMAASKEGQASIDDTNPVTAPLREYIEDTLAERVQAFLHGASLRGTYWEKRFYLQDMGASRNYTGYTCAALIRIENKFIKEAIGRAIAQLVNKTDSNLKSNVKQALDNVADSYLKETGKM